MGKREEESLLNKMHSCSQASEVLIRSCISQIRHEGIFGNQKTTKAKRTASFACISADLLNAIFMLFRLILDECHLKSETHIAPADLEELNVGLG